MTTPRADTPECCPPVSLAEKGAQAADAFARHFGHPPQWLAAAPGRINVIGEHVDYCDGLVLPMAIDRHVLMAARPVEVPRITLYSLEAGQGVDLSLEGRQRPGPPAWANYVRGVIEGFRRREMKPVGLEVLIASDLPMGGGLSSSAALEVAAATLVEASIGQNLTPTDIALICQQAEHDFAGVPCGIMDQFASVYGREGHLLLIDCRSLDVTPVPLHDPSVTLLVINTHRHHELGSSEYPLRRQQCEDAARRLGLPALRDATAEQVAREGGAWPEVLRRRARHVVTEIDRTRRAADALASGDWEQAGHLMDASHDSLRDDFEVSCAELDTVVSLARELGRAGGVYGCRMTGGGFGGCCIALVESDRALEVARAIGLAYARATGVQPTLFTSRPAAGARLL